MRLYGEAKSGLGALRRCSEVDTVDHYAAVDQWNLAGDCPEQRRLARAVGAAQAEYIAPAERNTHAASGSALRKGAKARARQSPDTALPATARTRFQGRTRCGVSQRRP